MIRKTKKGYKVISHKTGKCLGIYPSQIKARARVVQLKKFGKLKEESKI